MRWFFGEGGAVGHNGPGWPNSLAANDGWRHKDVYNGDLGAYLNMMRYWMDKATKTHAWQRGDVLGMVLFTSGGGDLWRWFEVKQPEMSAIADFVRVYMANIDKPIPPDPPDPPLPPDPPTSSNLVNGSFEDGWTDIAMTAQQPHGWVLNRAATGNVRGRPISGVPECVHKLNDQLPPDEQLGGANALILDGKTCYKVFEAGAVWSASLRQVVAGNAPGKRVTVTVPVNIHFDGRGAVYDIDDTGLQVFVNGVPTVFWMTKGG